VISLPPSFTPIEARRAFPCFDEPRFKTPWEITLRVPLVDKAFSNNREISDDVDAEGWRTVRFAVTEPLPAEHPLWGYDNVAITPHCAAVYDGWDIKSVRMFADNLKRYRSGEPRLPAFCGVTGSS